MAENIYKFGGIDPLSRSESERGEAEPETDPRGGGGTEVSAGMHMMSAVEQLEPVAGASMAYFDPDAPDLSLAELQDAVEDGRVELQDVLTKTDRFRPTVNPRASRRKGGEGDLPADSDADLWHVPTNNYTPVTPRSRFSPLAHAIDSNDGIDNSGVHGEFRTRRRGGEVFGEVWFDDFTLGDGGSDPVRLGLKFGYNYFGDRAFFIQPWAQQTRCKNSVAPLDEREVVMAHNRDPNWREVWDEAVRDLGIYGDELSRAIDDARRVMFDFSGALSDLDTDREDDGVISVPMSVEAFYEHLGFPDPRACAEHAMEESDAAGDEGGLVSAWHVHAGATYWLSWGWNGSEDSRAFREYRRAANDLLFNPHQMVDRAREEFVEDRRDEIVREVVGEGASLEDATDEQRAEIESRMMDNDAVSQMETATESLGDLVERFEDTEERLNRVQEAM